MAEEKVQPIGISNDDIHVLRVLLHSIRGSSPVSTTEFVATFADGE